MTRNKISRLFKKFLRNEIEVLLDSAPGPSPWYLDSSKSTFSTTKFGKVYWKYMQKSGKTWLESSDNIALVICGPYQYIKPISNDCFLHWHQSNSTSVLLSFYDFNIMAPIIHPDQTIQEMDEKKIRFVTNGGLVSSVNILTADVNNIIELDFPSPINQQDELLILADSPIGGRVIVVAKPSKGTYVVYPQDWFNKGDFDLGYQWITRVARDPETGRIVGDGIRMGQFMLDSSLRQLDKWIIKRA